MHRTTEPWNWRRQDQRPPPPPPHKATEYEESKRWNPWGNPFTDSDYGQDTGFDWQGFYEKRRDENAREREKEEERL